MSKIAKVVKIQLSVLGYSICIRVFFFRQTWYELLARCLFFGITRIRQRSTLVIFLYKANVTKTKTKQNKTKVIMLITILELQFVRSKRKTKNKNDRVHHWNTVGGVANTREQKEEKELHY